MRQAYSGRLANHDVLRWTELTARQDAAQDHVAVLHDVDFCTFGHVRHDIAFAGGECSAAAPFRDGDGLHRPIVDEDFRAATCNAIKVDEKFLFTLGVDVKADGAAASESVDAGEPR